MTTLDDYKTLMFIIDRDETEQAAFLGALLYDTLKPKSVIDWGCASGLYLVPFKERGCEVLGIDAEPTAGRLLDANEFWRTDIRKPASTLEKFDLALCIETAEHLQPEYADQLVENVANSADTVFWSAAHPGQGGQHHWNEQEQIYWFKKFQAHGFLGHPEEIRINAAIRRNDACQKVGWLISNAMLLRRK